MCLMHAMRTLSDQLICGHVHDEVIIECTQEVPVESICDLMAQTPDWMKDILLRADGYICQYYQKDA